jgi:hypothetical protein
MKAQSLNSLKKELALLAQPELVKLCLRLARARKENKELLDYLLFDSNYEPEFIRKVKEELDGLFSEINRSNIYYDRKSIRRILRITNKYVRYSGQKRTEVELRLHFCSCLNQSGIMVKPGTALDNLYKNQVIKIGKVISSLHEDLQHDYNRELKGL